MRRLTAVAVGLILAACSAPEAPVNVEESNYLNYSQRDDKWTGGVKVIPVETEIGTFNVWTKRVGNNPDMKVLLLHGGPGATHEYFESADSYFPNAEVEYYYYDQLGSGNSDNPEDERLWDLERFVDEVEQVRIALGLDASNFVLLGHSWGGILGDGKTPLVLYAPCVRHRCKMSFWFVATINLSIGNPILLAIKPAKISPKLPVGTVKLT